MTNRALRDAIKQAIRVSSDRALQYRTREFRQRHLVSSEQAERMIAYLNDVPLEDFVTDDELAETRRLLTREQLPLVHVVRPSGPPARKVLKVRSKELDDPLLPPSVKDEARRMAEVYPYLYVFENSVRNFIQTAMEKAHGHHWWDGHVGKGVREEVDRRIKEEEQNAWHGKRGDHPIHYTNIGDLIKIVKTNDSTFAPFFRGLKSGIGWLEIRLDEIELSRNAVAHHRALSNNDIDGIKRYFEQWQAQLRAWKDLLPP